MEKQFSDTTHITVSAKGQIVIPAELRKQFGIEPGTKLAIRIDATQHQIILTPITREYIRSLRGKYQGKGLLKALKESKRHANDTEE